MRTMENASHTGHQKHLRRRPSGDRLDDAVSHAKSHGINIVLIDTAGRMQTNQNLMNELVKVKRVVCPDLTVLTVDSLIGNDAVMQAEEFNKPSA